ncbi:MAG TPA: hypothetical protein VGO49_13745 [Bradyrhizobium sp.]|jgi:hypothetical protein|nr:hypothetical protein [Bradyrhizobium sp.]
MIFAICGLTVVGTGTERAGTSSTGVAAVCAVAAGNPVAPIAAHNSVVARSLDVTNVRIAAAGFFIAFPGSVFCSCFNEYRDDARQTLFLQPRQRSIIPEHKSLQMLESHRAATEVAHSILILASWITLRQRSSSPRT